MSYGKLVRDFHIAFGHPAPELPTSPDRELNDFRLRLEVEEINELEAWLERHALVVNRREPDPEEVLHTWTQIADAIGDILYVVYGRAVAYGLPIGQILQIIHEANMEKLGPDGKPILNGCDWVECPAGLGCDDSGHFRKPDLPKGKVLKPEGWTPPDERIKELLRPLLARKS